MKQSGYFDNYCPEIYRSVYIDRHNDTHVKVAPCCQAGRKLEPVETFDFKTSPYLNELRQEFDHGEYPDACERCWSTEKIGQKSRRQNAIEFFQESQCDATVELQSLDHSSTWACNLACIMCNPDTSSLWATQENLTKDQLISVGRYFQRSNNFLDKLDLHNLKKLHFNGGEPLLNNDQVDLLTKLDQQRALNNVFISYNTNGTQMPSNKIIDLWSRARLVKLYFSIDAVDQAFEYVRWPGNWNQTSENMLHMKATLPSNVMFGFNVTVGSYNLFEVKDVYHWFNQHIKYNKEGDASDFCWQFAHNFDPKHLSREIKLRAIDEFKSISELHGIAVYLEANLNCVEDQTWMSQLDTLDSKRNTAWKKSLKIAQIISNRHSNQ
jgi:hypothetical protein